MREKTPIIKKFNFAFSHTEKLLDRRQFTTSFYLSVNTGILAALGFLVKNTHLTGVWLIAAVLLLLVAGIVACFIWRSLLRQYAILLDWWYARLRELEVALPDSANLITREYQELYSAAKDRPRAHRIGMTQRETALTWVFTALYAVFALGVIVSTLLSHS